MHPLMQAVSAAARPEDARAMERYFQVKPGGYGEGDVFLGVKLRRLRVIARPHYDEEFFAAEWLELLRSPVHEHRMAGLVVMAERARRLSRRAETRAPEFTRLFETFLANTAHVNNWDLVDVSSGPVVGGYLLRRDRSVLDELARSTSVWERRIAMVSTHELIRAGDTSEVYRLAELLLSDEHDLIHKAVGWMLREAGRRVDTEELRDFLDAHATRMSRTTLRYAIERLAPPERRHYLTSGRSAPPRAG